MCMQVPKEPRCIASTRLELEAYVNNPIWVLEPELWSSVRTACTVNHGDISPDLKVCFCEFFVVNLFKTGFWIVVQGGLPP